MNLVVKNETGNAKSSITLNYTIHQPPFTHPFVHRLEHDEEGGELWTMRHQTSLRKWKKLIVNTCDWHLWVDPNVGRWDWSVWPEDTWQMTTSQNVHTVFHVTLWS